MFRFPLAVAHYANISFPYAIQMAKRLATAPVEDKEALQYVHVSLRYEKAYRRKENERA